MSMPLHQISAIPSQDAISARVYRSKTKDKEQNEKTLGHSMSHPSNISKAASSPPSTTAPASAFSRTSVTPSNQDICSSSAVFSECCYYHPVQSAVVLKAPPYQSSLTQGLTVTVVCKDTLQASKKNLFGSDWDQVLSPAKNTKARRALRFSKSLSDVGEKTQDTLESFDYMERTCSEGKLVLPQGSSLTKNRLHHKGKRAEHCPPLGHSKPSSLLPLSTNHSAVPKREAGRGSVRIPLLEEKADGEARLRSQRLLRYLLSLSRGSSASSLHRFHELECHASHLHTAKSSSWLAGSMDFCSDEMGDDDVFEDTSSARLKNRVLRAPLCSVEKDSDLDCPSLLSEKCTPISPVSTSGDACRLVCQEPPSGCFC